eukprot:5631721-Amphidinium_carterae.1
MSETPVKKGALDKAWKTLPNEITGRKQKNAASEDEVATKTKRAIAETCPWISMEEACKVKIDGKTLYDRVYEKKREKLVDGKK